MVSALDSGSRGPGSSPGRVIVLCSWARHFTLTVPLSTRSYLDAMDYSIPSRRHSNIASRLMLQKPRYELRQSWATRLVRLTFFFVFAPVLSRLVY